MSLAFSPRSIPASTPSSTRPAECHGLVYLIMMGVRLLEMRRLLKPTGSIYLHCDPTASHY